MGFGQWKPVQLTIGWSWQMLYSRPVEVLVVSISYSHSNTTHTFVFTVKSNPHNVVIQQLKIWLINHLKKWRTIPPTSLHWIHGSMNEGTCCRCPVILDRQKQNSKIISAPDRDPSLQRGAWIRHNISSYSEANGYTASMPKLRLYNRRSHSACVPHHGWCWYHSL